MKNIHLLGRIIYDMLRLISTSISLFFLFSCSSAVEHDYYMKEIDVFAYSAELELTGNGKFIESEIDAHARLGGIAKGTFHWEDNVLILNYVDRKDYFIEIDSALHRIEEYDSLVKYKEIIDSNDSIIELTIKHASVPFNRPSRTSFKFWEKGRIENFSDMLNDYKNEPDVLFEEK